MKVYTRTGDAGTTSLVGGTRVAKTHPRVQCYGQIDELNSWIGLVISRPEQLPTQVVQTLTRVQNTLFDIGTMLATEPESRWQPAPLPPDAVQQLETDIDRLDGSIPTHNRFVLPGGCPVAAQAQIARTVARRCERTLLELAPQVNPSPEILAFINRLSDYLFVAARAANHYNNTPEIFWQQSI